jgi:hypothetical protein
MLFHYDKQKAFPDLCTYPSLYNNLLNEATSFIESGALTSPPNSDFPVRVHFIPLVLEAAPERLDSMQELIPRSIDSP